MVGLDLGGTKCFAVAMVGDEVVADLKVATPRGADAVLEALVRAASEVAAGVGPVAAVGVGVPGLVDNDGVFHAGANLPGVRMLPLRDLLTGRLGVPVRVENDATCAAWGEYALGAARGTRYCVVVTQGTGIGGGIILDGELFRGAHGFGGEIGHMVVDPSGPPCPCGKRGCWERYASGSALGAMARAEIDAGMLDAVAALAGDDPVVGEHVTAAAAIGDPEARDLLARFAWWVALGLANLAELVDPERFVLGGGLVLAGDLLLSPTRAAFADLLQSSGDRPPVEVVAAELADRAGAMGAAALAAR